MAVNRIKVDKEENIFINSENELTRSDTFARYQTNEKDVCKNNYFQWHKWYRHERTGDIASAKSYPGIL